MLCVICLAPGEPEPRFGYGICKKHEDFPPTCVEPYTNAVFLVELVDYSGKVEKRRVFARFPDVTNLQQFYGDVLTYDAHMAYTGFHRGVYRHKKVYDQAVSWQVSQLNYLRITAMEVHDATPHSPRVSAKPRVAGPGEDGSSADSTTRLRVSAGSLRTNVGEEAWDHAQLPDVVPHWRFILR